MEFLSRLFGLEYEKPGSSTTEARENQEASRETPVSAQPPKNQLSPQEMIDLWKPRLIISICVGVLALLIANPFFQEADKNNSGFPQVGGFFGLVGLIALLVAFVAGATIWENSEKLKKRPVRKELLTLLEARIQAMQSGQVLGKSEPTNDTLKVEVLVPLIDKWSAPKTTSFTKAFLESSKTGVNESLAALTLLSSDKGMHWIVTTHNPEGALTLPEIEQLVRPFYPGTQVMEKEDEEGPYPFYSQYAILTRKQEYFFGPALPVEQIASHDPLSVIAQSMTNLLPGERLAYRIFVVRKLVSTQAEILEYTTVSTREAQSFNRLRSGYPAPERDLLDIFIERGWDKLLGTTRIPRPDWSKAEHELYGAKLAQPIYACQIALALHTPHQERLGMLSAPLGAIGGLSLPSENLVESGFVSTPVRITNGQDEDADLKRLIDKFNKLASDEEGMNRYVFYLTASELAAFWHLPYQGFMTPLGPKQVQAPERVRKLSSGIVLGDNCFGSIKTPIHMLNADRNEHMIVFGSTGTGKSTYLLNLIHQDIAQGRGVAVIDPHGDLVKEILDTSIPQERKEDVLVWDIANTENPPPLNLLAIPPGFDPQTAVTQLLAVFNSIWPEFSWHQMGHTLEMALMTLVFDETPTLLDIDRLFVDDEYRDKLLDKADDIILDRFWEGFDQERLAQQRELITPVNRRLGAFYGNKNLRVILCHKMGLNLTSLIAENKVVLISLKAPDDMQLPEHSMELLGTILINQFQLAIMARAATQHFYLYVDEAQYFVTTAIDKIFTEARKRKLSLTLSHQFLGQLKGKTLDAVMENVGAMTVFGTGADSAREVAPHFRPEFDVDDLIKFDMFQAAVRMRVEGRQQPTFTLNTRPAPRSIEGKPTAEEVRQLSVQKYTPMTRGEVLKWLNERYPSKRRRRKQDDGEFSDPVE